MKAIVSFLNSSIGKKVVMSATGLLMVLFLIAHLIGNLLILKSKQSFNEYSHGLISMKPWIWLAEAGLAALFVVHIVNAVQMHFRNQAARPQGYYGFGLAGHTSRKTPMSSNMIKTGVLVILFVIWHLIGMKFGSEYTVQTPTGEMRDLHRTVIEYFSSTWYVMGYCSLLFVLGLHLLHGIDSAFQTLGIPHRTGLMRLTQGLAAALTLGFIIIPIIVLFAGDRLS